jgi:hypothetical protein
VGDEAGQPRAAERAQKKRDYQPPLVVMKSFK